MNHDGRRIEAGAIERGLGSFGCTNFSSRHVHLDVMGKGAKLVPGCL